MTEARKVRVLFSGVEDLGKDLELVGFLFELGVPFRRNFNHKSGFGFVDLCTTHSNQTLEWLLAEKFPQVLAGFEDLVGEKNDGNAAA